MRPFFYNVVFFIRRAKALLLPKILRFTPAGVATQKTKVLPLASGAKRALRRKKTLGR